MPAAPWRARPEMTWSSPEPDQLRKPFPSGTEAMKHATNPEAVALGLRGIR